MSKRELGTVEDTLFVPMLGRIYATVGFKHILNDEKALELKSHLPEEVIRNDRQTQYTYLASASRSANMDRHIRDFTRRNPEGIIVQLGVGLETAYYRNDNGQAQWFGVDLPNVIEYRRSLLPETEREKYIAADAFGRQWIEEIRAEYPDQPVLVTASGLFYYFEEEKVIALMRTLQDYGRIEIVFDAVSRSGMTMMKKKHMKTVGHEDAGMFFYVDSAEKLAGKIGGNVRVRSQENFYRKIDKSGLSFSTKASMIISDALSMVKLIHLDL